MEGDSQWQETFNRGGQRGASKQERKTRERERVCACVHVRARCVWACLYAPRARLLTLLYYLCQSSHVHVYTHAHTRAHVCEYGDALLVAACFSQRVCATWPAMPLEIPCCCDLRCDGVMPWRLSCCWVSSKPPLSRWNHGRRLCLEFSTYRTIVTGSFQVLIGSVVNLACGGRWQDRLGAICCQTLIVDR